MLSMLHIASLVFWVFIVCGLVYFVRDAHMRGKNTYVPRTRWNTDYYTPTADPFLMEDK